MNGLSPLFFFFFFFFLNLLSFILIMDLASTTWLLGLSRGPGICRTALFVTSSTCRGREIERMADRIDPISLLAQMANHTYVTTDETTPYYPMQNRVVPGMDSMKLRRLVGQKSRRRSITKEQRHGHGRDG
ncbi:hypothetical protein F4861DRAFT_515252 [Xylaria intraflava]|nr:hypothetical protein F4861DRAFT_515252 [Xylaria intraflava]